MNEGGSSRPHRYGYCAVAAELFQALETRTGYFAGRGVQQRPDQARPGARHHRGARFPRGQPPARLCSCRRGRRAAAEDDGYTLAYVHNPERARPTWSSSLPRTSPARRWPAFTCRPGCRSGSTAAGSRRPTDPLTAHLLRLDCALGGRNPTAAICSVARGLNEWTKPTVRPMRSVPVVITISRHVSGLAFGASPGRLRLSRVAMGVCRHAQLRITPLVGAPAHGRRGCWSPASGRVRGTGRRRAEPAGRIQSAHRGVRPGPLRPDRLRAASGRQQIHGR